MNEQNYNKYLDLLKEYVSFKSISTDPAYKLEIENTVKWLSQIFKKNGFEVETWKGKECNPVVYSSYTLSDKNETVLLYGHYDVQPASIDDGWKDDPFTVAERKGKLYARGVVDNKGQTLIHLFTIFNLIKQNKLNYNIKVLIEGNEETSNEDMPSIIKDHAKQLKTDYILISDGELFENKPAIEISLRGGFNCTLKYTTADNNVHSGIYGGAIPSAANELSKFLAKLYDKNNKVTVPGFYDDVDKIAADQRVNNEKLLPDIKEIFRLTGVKTLLMERGMDYFTQIGLRPTVQVTGLKSGYIGEGYANIVPATAEARLNFRTVESQDYKAVIKSFKDFVAKNTPKYVTYDLTFVHPYSAVKINVSSSKVKETVTILERAFGEKPLFKPVGGSIPVVTDFKKLLGKDTLLVSLGNGDCNMHGVDENYTVALIKKGLKFSELFFSTD